MVPRGQGRRMTMNGLGRTFAVLSLAASALSLAHCGYDDCSDCRISGDVHDACYDDRDCSSGLICGACRESDPSRCMVDVDPCGGGPVFASHGAPARLGSSTEKQPAPLW